MRYTTACVRLMCLQRNHDLTREKYNVRFETTSQQNAVIRWKTNQVVNMAWLVLSVTNSQLVVDEVLMWCTMVWLTMSDWSSLTETLQTPPPPPYTSTFTRQSTVNTPTSHLASHDVTVTSQRQTCQTSPSHDPVSSFHWPRHCVNSQPHNNCQSELTHSLFTSSVQHCTTTHCSQVPTTEGWPGWVGLVTQTGNVPVLTAANYTGMARLSWPGYTGR